MIFDGFLGGPGAEGERRVRVIGWSLGLIAVTKESGGALQHAKYIISSVGIKGMRKNQNENYEITKTKL